MTAHQRNLTASIDPAKLDRLAEVAIKVGLNLQPGQDLLLTAPSVALPLVRKIAEHAYKAGAGLVTPILSDGVGPSRCGQQRDRRRREGHGGAHSKPSRPRAHTDLLLTRSNMPQRERCAKPPTT